MGDDEESEKEASRGGRGSRKDLDTAKLPRCSGAVGYRSQKGVVRDKSVHFRRGVGKKGQKGVSITKGGDDLDRRRRKEKSTHERVPAAQEE